MTEKETLEVKDWINQEIEKELLELRGLYEQAVANNQETFVWGDEEMSTSYTKYFLEFHESQLKTQ